MTDLILAICHHLLVFSVAAILAFEIGAVRLGLDARDITRIAKVDLWYGILAAMVIVVGFCRAIFAAKGWGYYSTNLFFWMKIAAFVIVGLLSIMPTLTFVRWRRHVTALPTPEEIAAVRRYLWAEAAVFGLIPIFAAAMARGYGALV